MQSKEKGGGRDGSTSMGIFSFAGDAAGKIRGVGVADENISTTAVVLCDATRVRLFGSINR